MIISILPVFSLQFLVYNEFIVNQLSNKYPLEERTAKFGESVIQLCRSIKGDNISNPIINQLVRSSTSIGANYMEANGASSKKDFQNKIFICKKEELRKLWSETQELTLIFQKITSTLKNDH